MSRPANLTRVHSLLNAFSSPTTPLPDLLSNFTSRDPWALEHGLPALAPFLGRKYTGLDGLKEYFTVLTETLEIEWMRFEGEEGWVVDVGEKQQQGHGDKEGKGGGERERKVSLRGEARFKWKSTGQAWEERFAYRIGLVDDEDGGGGGGGDVKVKSYEVWADTGAAYLARVGELDRLS